MMKTVKVGNRSFSMKRVRTFSPAKEGFDQERLAKKYPKAMSALVILTLAHQANPLKALLAIASGKRQYDEKFTEKLLADAEKFISTLSDRKRTFSKGYRITEKDYQEYCDWQAGKIDSTRLLDIIKDEGEYEDKMGQWAADHADESSRVLSTSNFSDDEKYVVYLEGGSISTKSNARIGNKRVSIEESGLTREEALEYKRISNKSLSPGEKKYYRMKYGLAPESKVHYMSQKDYSEITSDEEFRKYAHNVMKEAHGDEYSEEVTNKVVDELLKNNKGAEYGELIGRLTSGLGE